MRVQRRVIRFGIVAALMLAVSSCAATFRNHGYVPADRDLQDIVVGVDTRGTVETLVGRPTTAGILDESGWYYVRTRVRTYLYFEPEAVEREVVAITFSDKGIVENIERFGLEEGRVVALSRRVTDKNTKGIGFLRQAFGNLGRIRAEDFLGN